MKFKLPRNLKYALAFFLVIFFAGLVGQPFPHGYLHPADPLVMLAAVVLPAPWAIAASAVACVVVDLIKGYYLLSLTTLLIKILMVLVIKGLLKTKPAKAYPDILLAPVALKVANDASPHVISGMRSSGGQLLEVAKDIGNILRLPWGAVQATAGAPFGYFNDGLSNIWTGVCAPFQLVTDIILLPFAFFGGF